MTTENNGVDDKVSSADRKGGAGWRRRAGVGVLAGVLAVGAAAGAGATRLAERLQAQPVMLLQPAPIASLRDGAPAAVKGRVAERFGATFVVDDGAGRALVDTGPRGEGRDVVAPDETVTVQGRFERGRLRAQVLVHADGRTEGFEPAKPPKPDRGPGRDAPPPPPAARPAT